MFWQHKWHLDGMEIPLKNSELQKVKFPGTTKKIETLIQIRDQLHRKAIITDGTEDWTQFKRMKNHVTTLVRQVKTKFYRPYQWYQGKPRKCQKNVETSQRQRSFTQNFPKFNYLYSHKWDSSPISNKLLTVSMTIPSKLEQNYLNKFRQRMSLLFII